MISWGYVCCEGTLIHIDINHRKTVPIFALIWSEKTHIHFAHKLSEKFNCPLRDFLPLNFAKALTFRHDFYIIFKRIHHRLL